MVAALYGWLNEGASFRAHRCHLWKRSTFLTRAMLDVFLLHYFRTSKMGLVSDTISQILWYKLCLGIVRTFSGNTTKALSKWPLSKAHSGG